MLRPTFALLCGALILAGTPVLAQSDPPAETPVLASLSDAEIAQRVQSVIDWAKTRPEMVGLSIAVGRGGHVVVDRGVGTANLEWNQPADAQTIFRIGSLTKQFTAAAIMTLAEQGKLALDDPLARYLPDVDLGGHSVTIRQLLNHTSGIPNYTAQLDFMGKSDRLDLGNKGVMALIAGKPFDFEPGEKWAYSNTNYLLLGMIVEALSGQSYADFMQAQFFGPLGLAHTRADSEAAIIPHRAAGYTIDIATNARRNAPLMATANAGAAGMLASTAGDLVRWEIALSGGKAVSPDSYAQMIGSTAATGMAGTAYGFGLVVTEMNGQQRIVHNGGINGFNSTLSAFPQSGLVTAVISNSGPMPSSVVEDRIILALLFDEPLPPERTTPQPGAEAALRKLIADEAAGTPDYGMMSPQLAEAVRTQLPQVQKIFQQLGAIQSVTFQEVNLQGLDTFRVEMANGALLFSMALYPDGKVATLYFRPAPPAP